MAFAENYEDVLEGKYPAKEHARKVAQWIIERGGDKNGTIYLEAQKQKLNEVSCNCRSCVVYIDASFRTMMAKHPSGTAPVIESGLIPS